MPGILRRSLYEVWGFNIVFLFHFIYFLNFEWRRFGLVDLEGNSVAFFQYSRELMNIIPLQLESYRWNQQGITQCEKS